MQEPKFRANQQVILTNKARYSPSGLGHGVIYTIDRVVLRPDSDSNAVWIKTSGVRNALHLYDEEWFMALRISNTERIARRMEELNETTI